jgi:VWFA-related protein
MLPLRHACITLSLALAASVAGVAAAEAQSAERIMIVSVLDDDGAPVRDLDAADFDIREDDAAREVLRVEPAGAGRQIAILVDTSEAAVRAASDFRRGLSAFVDGMHGDNQISIISFGGPPRILVQTTSDAERLREGIGRVFPQSGQAAYMLDAVYEVAEGFTRRGADRPVMVVVTTEGTDYSNRGGRQVLDRIDESGAAVYTLSVEARRRPFGIGQIAGGFGGGVDLRQQEFERDLVLARGTANSGGSRRDLAASSAIERAMRELVAELRNQYLVVYSRPASLIPPEDVRVSVDRAGLTARGTLLKSDETRNR